MKVNWLPGVAFGQQFEIQTSVNTTYDDALEQMETFTRQLGNASGSLGPLTVLKKDIFIGEGEHIRSGTDEDEPVDENYNFSVTLAKEKMQPKLTILDVYTGPGKATAKLTGALTQAAKAAKLTVSDEIEDKSVGEFRLIQEKDPLITGEGSLYTDDGAVEVSEAQGDLVGKMAAHAWSEGGHVTRIYDSDGFLYGKISDMTYTAKDLANLFQKSQPEDA